MADPLAHKVPCPRCRYDLRAITAPRCPECGLAFSWEAWRDGAVRDERPSRLDQADLLQPLDVLWRSLVEMVNCLAPRAAMDRLKREAPLSSALAMVVAGTLWVYAASVVWVFLLGLVASIASPYVALLNALLDAGPRITLIAVASSAAAFLTATAFPWLTFDLHTPRAWLRIGTHVVVSWALLATLVAGGSNALRNAGAYLAEETVASLTMTPLVTACALVLSRGWRGGRNLGGGRFARFCLALAGWIFVGHYGDDWLGSVLDPPTWIYPIDA